jgi:hypothetical protein
MARHRGPAIAVHCAHIARLALAAALSAGCTLTRLPVASPTHDPVPLHGDRAALWKVGAIEPILPRGDAFAEFQAARNLVYTLRRIDLFHEVDFARRLHCPIDLELVAGPRVDRFDSASFWLSLVTLSVKMDEHVSIPFHPASAPDERIELEYESGVWWGITPLVLSPLALFGALGDWTLGDTHDLEIRELRAQLLDRGGVLEQHVGRSPSGRCSEPQESP